MKGLVLSGGKGTRLRPLTYTGAKQLVPLANKPVLFYVVEDLVSAGITDIGIVVGDTAEQIEAAVGDGSAFGCQVSYIRQDRPGGLAHAVLTARHWLGEDRFVMYLGDNFIQGGIGRYVESFRSSSAAAHVLLYHVPNPQDFGVVEVSDGRIISLEEKPRDPRSDLALVGIYFFDHGIHEAVRAIEPSWRGELEITDAIRRLLVTGLEVVPHVLDGWFIDTGKMEDMLDANRLVLQDIKRRIDGRVADDCTVQGNVVVEEGAEVIGSTLRGPLIIGTGACVEGSYVGPFTAIGPYCTVRGSEIEHTIVMQRSQIVDVPHRIEDSLIGCDVTVSRSHSRPKAYKMMLGDHSKVGIL
ncbi:MAG: glucose-1-phosphate thymidylyltransferase [Chloroflexota bacterium]|nr:MAG: glucose-1-phosphate thymidylyltransferase [Chloroflexota bacterium]